MAGWASEKGAIAACALSASMSWDAISLASITLLLRSAGEPGCHRAEVGEFRAEYITGPDVHHVVHSPGKDGVTAPQRPPEEPQTPSPPGRPPPPPTAHRPPPPQLSPPPPRIPRP